MTPKEFCNLYSEQYGEPIDNVNQIVSHDFTGQELYDFVLAALRQPPVSYEVCKHRHIMHINSEIGWLCLECRKFSDDKQVFR